MVPLTCASGEQYCSFLGYAYSNAVICLPFKSRCCLVPTAVTYCLGSRHSPSFPTMKLYSNWCSRLKYNGPSSSKINETAEKATDPILHAAEVAVQRSCLLRASHRAHTELQKRPASSHSQTPLLPPNHGQETSAKCLDDTDAFATPPTIQHRARLGVPDEPPTCPRCSQSLHARNYSNNAGSARINHSTTLNSGTLPATTGFSRLTKSSEFSQRLRSISYEQRHNVAYIENISPLQRRSCNDHARPSRNRGPHPIPYGQSDASYKPVQPFHLDLSSELKHASAPPTGETAYLAQDDWNHHARTALLEQTNLHAASRRSGHTLYDQEHPAPRPKFEKTPDSAKSVLSPPKHTPKSEPPPPDTMCLVCKNTVSGKMYLFVRS